jgi:hypothetical protein
MLKLGFARVGIWQVLHKILGSFLVPFLRDDDVGFAVVGSRFGIDTREFLDSLWFRRSFASACSTPGTLETEIRKG